jgi:hypothetical protein
MILTISESDLQELERLNKALAIAPKGKEWAHQASLIRFIEDHPTILPYCIQAGREKKAAKIAAEQDVAPMESLHAGGRR